MMFTVVRLVRIKQFVGRDVMCEAGFNNTFNYFGYERKVRNWTVARELFLCFASVRLCVFSLFFVLTVYFTYTLLLYCIASFLRTPPPPLNRRFSCHGAL